MKVVQSKWQKENMKYLGIRICRSKEAMVKENIMPIVNYMQEKCQLLKSYSLTWMGRIATVKTVMLPKRFGVQCKESLIHLYGMIKGLRLHTV